MSEQGIQPDGSQPVAWVIQRYLQKDNRTNMYSENFVSDLQKQLADHAARVAELEQRVAERANWICPETYALTLQAVAIEAEAKDRAERRLGEVERERDAAREELSFCGMRIVKDESMPKTEIRIYQDGEHMVTLRGFIVVSNPEKPA